MDQIREYVEAMFRSLPKTEGVVKSKIQIIDTMEQKYESLIREGKSSNEALGTVILEFGDIEELRGELEEAGLLERGPGKPSDPLPQDQQLSEHVQTFSEPTPEPDPELAGLEAEYWRFLPKKRIANCVAVMLYILAPFAGVQFFPMMVFIFIAAGVGLMIYFNGKAGDYERLINERRIARRIPIMMGTDVVDHETTVKKRSLLYAMLWLAAAILYLVIGFGWDWWHPGWMIFLLVPLVTMGLELFRKNG